MTPPEELTVTSASLSSLAVGKNQNVETAIAFEAENILPFPQRAVR